jgi:hypothetical protein
MAKDLEKTRERMTRMIAAFRRSGKTREEFAREAGITVSKLDYWKRRVTGVKTRARGSGAPGFVPVQLRLDNGSEAAEVEIVLAGGERVRVGQGVSTQRLREILTALRQC